MAQPFYTIGHSNRSFGDFVDLLRSAEVTCVADVHTVPRSRANPQYSQDVLPEALATFEIGYEHVGRRARDVPPEVNAFWQNESFSQLRGLRDERTLSPRIDEVAGARPDSALCRDVCRGRMVAVPPANYRGLLDSRR
jgi:hypothetical protein